LPDGEGAKDRDQGIQFVIRALDHLLRDG